MTADALLMAPGGRAAESRDRSRWIESVTFDLLFFFAAPLAGLSFLALSYFQPTRYLTAGLFFAVGMGHYLSTFSFFLGDDNRRLYRPHALAFYGGPLVLLIIAGALRFITGLELLLSAIYAWNIYHVALQNCGILSVYRHLAGRPREEKLYANGVIISSNFALAFWHIDTFEPFHKLIASLLPHYVPYLRSLLAVTLLVALASYGIYRLRSGGRRVSLVEAAFLASAVLMFTPYLWVENIELATGGMLFGHFIQYLALVWLLHRRKYATRIHGTPPQRLLSTLSRNVYVLAGFLFALIVFVYGLDRMTRVLGVTQVYYWLWNTLALTHFYLDGLIWSFKRPYVRESLGPYLAGRTQGAA